MTEQQAIEKIHSVYPSGKKEGLTPPQRDPKIKTNFIR